MGIYVFNRAVLAEALENSMTDFGREVIPALLGRKKLFAHIFEGYWEDIGTVRAFFEANLALAQPLPPFNFFDATTPGLHPLRVPAGVEAQTSAPWTTWWWPTAASSRTPGSSTAWSASAPTSARARTWRDVIVMGADYYETPEQIAANLSRGPASPRGRQGLHHPPRDHRQECPHRGRLDAIALGQGRWRIRRRRRRHPRRHPCRPEGGRSSLLGTVV